VRYADRVDDERRDYVRTRFLRVSVLVIVVLGAAAIVISMIPSVEVYKDANDCFGHALGRVFSAHGGGRSSCESSWVLVDTRPPANVASMLSYLAIVLAPAMVIWKWPRLGFAVAWSPWTMVASVVMILSTFELFGDFALRTKQLPLAHVFDWVMVVLLVGLMLVIPVATLVIGIATRKRPPPPPVFPTARVVER
jgi:hypothetical protein